jgi:hypothetical protein
VSASAFHLNSTFDPHRISAFTHDLVGHPLLELNSLFELARRLPDANVRFIDKKITADTHFVHDDKRNYNLEEKILGVANSKTWVAFHYIETDPIYRELVESLLEQTRPFVDPKDPGMKLKQGWIFISPPNSVTPFHMDLEQNFLIQIQGKKKLSVWDASDRIVTPEPILEMFHSHRTLKDFRYKEEFQSRAHVFDIEPGKGVFMPSTSPHWVQNGDGPSITMSLTFWSEHTQKRSYLHRCNHLIRKMGIPPSRAGANPLRDAAKTKFFEILVNAKREFSSGFKPRD